MDALSGDADFNVVHVVFGWGRPGLRQEVAPWRVIDDQCAFIVVGWDRSFIRAGLVDLDGITVKIRVRKERGRLPEIHDREEELAVVLVDAGAAADDLLELGHGPDAPVEDDEMAGLGIDARAHEPGGRAYDGISGFWINEVIELGLALVVVASDAHDVFRVGGGEVGVGVDHGLAHAFGVVDILAKDDRLGEAVGRFEERRNLGGNQGCALFQDEVLVVVGDVVFAILDELAVFVALALFGAPAVEVFVEPNANDFVGGEEAVGDALPEGVGVDRVAEVFDVGDVFRFLRRGGEADLGGGGKVFEDFAPRGIVGRATAVALVNHD